MSARQRPRLQMVKKNKRKKWYSVYAQFEYEQNIERAKFLHAGDAYHYATAYLVDNWKSFAEQLLQVQVEY